MKVKLKTLLNARESLSILNHTKGLGVVTAYRIMKNVDTVEKELKYYDKKNLELCEKYGVRDDKARLIVENGVCNIKIECAEQFREEEKELKKLLDETVEISIVKIDIEALDKAGLAPAQLAAIEFMLNIKEE